MPRPNHGTVTKVADGKYRIRVQHGIGLDGKPMVVSETFYGSELDAKARCSAMVIVANGAAAAGQSLTVRQYWLYVFPDKPSSRGTERSAVTMKFYRDQMDRAILPMIGEVALAKVTHQMIVRCINASASPVNTKRTLSAVLRSAYDDGLMPEKPLDRRVPVYRDKREQVEPWSRFEAAEALSLLRGCDPRIYIYLILGLSGLRKEEALGVRPCDIRIESTYSFATGEQLETMTVTVAQTYTEVGGVVPRAKNAASLRRVPVLVSGRDDLKRLLAEGRASAADADEWATSRLVNANSSWFGKLWRRTLADAGIRYIPPNMLRHTSDTLALAAGVDSDLNDKMHGRAQHSCTYENYFRPDIGLMEHAARAVGDIIRLTAD